MTQTCMTCAWRGGCNKKFSIADPSRCADYSRDVSLPVSETMQEHKININTEKTEINSENKPLSKLFEK